MKKIATAQRVSREISDNFVFQRSLMAYHEAARLVGGEVLEIGTGTGYGIDLVAPRATRFTTLDKQAPDGLVLPGNTEFVRAVVPPLPFENERFDCVISFQVIEHIRRDRELVREVKRVLRPGGRFIVTTPNARMSLTRNPWHVREYTPEELAALLAGEFASVEAMGVCGNRRVEAYYEKNREGVRRITRFDPLKLQYRLPRWMLRLPYDLMNRLNRRRAAGAEPRPDRLDPHGGLPDRSGDGQLLRPVLHRTEIDHRTAFSYSSTALRSSPPKRYSPSEPSLRTTR